jgi:hypothetical protein
MPLKNYTTQISAMKSIGEIQGKLVAHGAIDISIHYGPDKEPESLFFSIDVGNGQHLPFRLPANVGKVATLLSGMGDPNYRRWDQDYQIQKAEKIKIQASRVAWRIIKDWVDAQLAIIETEMVSIEEVFFPYMMIKDGRHTLFEAFKEHGYYLPEGRS